MSFNSAKEKVKLAALKDPDIICEADEISKTLGSNPDYLQDVFGITKSDLIRLERKGLAIKARYQIDKTKEHRIRWILLREVLQ